MHGNFEMIPRPEGRGLLTRIKKDKHEILMEEIHGHEDGNIKKIRACPYYSPFKASCVNHNNHGYDEEYPNKYPRCNLRGKYSECKIVDKVIELTLDEYNSVIHREYLYIKGRADLVELEDKYNTQMRAYNEQEG